MDKEIVTFGDTEVEKDKFHQYKTPISIYNVDISEIVVSTVFLLIKKVLNILLGTKMVKKLLLCIILPKMRAYKILLKLNLSFLIKSDELLEKI